MVERLWMLSGGRANARPALADGWDDVWTDAGVCLYVVVHSVVVVEQNEIEAPPTFVAGGREIRRNSSG
jgi:hypothetical protein